MSYILSDLEGRNTLGTICPASRDDSIDLVDGSGDNGASVGNIVTRSREENRVFTLLGDVERIGQIPRIGVVQCLVKDDGLGLVRVSRVPLIKNLTDSPPG